MSPHVNNFVTDLVEMAKAMDELPKVQAQLNALEESYIKAMGTIEDRELRIIHLKAEVETHLASIRTLEVARDDAEFRFLELEEHTRMAIAYIRDGQTYMGKALSLIDPPAPEPVSTIQPAEEGQHTSWGQPIDPIPSSSDQGSSVDPLPKTTRQAEHSWATNGGEITGQASDPSPGQSEADPILTKSIPETVHSMEVDVPVKDHTADTITSSSSSNGKYSGKLYADWSYYVPLDKWIEGGGTEYSYNYRHPGSVDKNPA